MLGTCPNGRDVVILCDNDGSGWLVVRGGDLAERNCMPNLGKSFSLPGKKGGTFPTISTSGHTIAEFLDYVNARRLKNAGTRKHIDVIRRLAESHSFAFLSCRQFCRSTSPGCRIVCVHWCMIFASHTQCPADFPAVAILWR